MTPEIDYTIIMTRTNHKLIVHHVLLSFHYRKEDTWSAILRRENSQHRSTAFVSAQHGHIRRDKVGGHTSRRTIASRQPIRSHAVGRTQSNVRSQWRRPGQRISSEEETATLPNDIHQFPTGRARKGLFKNSLSRCLYQVRIKWNSLSNRNLIKRFVDHNGSSLWNSIIVHLKTLEWNFISKQWERNSATPY